MGHILQHPQAVATFGANRKDVNRKYRDIPERGIWDWTAIPSPRSCISVWHAALRGMNFIPLPTPL